MCCWLQLSVSLGALWSGAGEAECCWGITGCFLEWTKVTLVTCWPVVSDVVCQERSVSASPDPRLLSVMWYLGSFRQVLVCL